MWHGLALVGIVLALGGNTPLGPLLFHVPLFGDQRLQSRNILVADLALAVLLAYWADHPLSERSQRRRPATWRRRADPETVLGVLAPLAVITVVLLGVLWGAGLLRWLGVSPAAAAGSAGVAPWLVPYAVIGAAAIALVIFGRRLAPPVRARWISALVVTDVVVFTLLAVVAVLPGLGRAARPASAASPAAGASSATATARPVADLGFPGRFAIYDPGQLEAGELTRLGAPDLNVLSATASVQGYSSLVDGFYAAATGSHGATARGRTCSARPPSATGPSISSTPRPCSPSPVTWCTTAGGASRPPAPGTGQRDVAAGQQAGWYLGTPLDVARLQVPDARARRDAAAGIQVGLTTAAGVTRWFPATAASAAVLTVTPPAPVAAVAVMARRPAAAQPPPAARPARLGPPSVTEPGGTVLVADGQLQDALTTPHWGYAGQDGSFAVFADRRAAGPLSSSAAPARPCPEPPCGGWPGRRPAPRPRPCPRRAASG